MGTGEFNSGCNPAMDWHPIQGGVEVFLVASCHGNWDKLRPDGPLGLYVDFTFYLIHWGRVMYSSCLSVYLPPSSPCYVSGNSLL